MKILTLFGSLLLLSVNYAQTFNGGSGAILDNQTTNIPITVSVPQTSINTTTFGLETVCINLTHTYLADLTIQIVAPDGTTKTLSQGIGGGDDNMTNTCFNGFSTNPISSGTAPFTGTFAPMSQMGGVNNGQNPNGTWIVRVSDNYGADEGNVINCSITFGSTPCDYFQFSESDLPIVVINTSGQAIGYDIKTVVDMGIIYNGAGNRNHLVDPYNEYNGKIGIEYRGNYSLSLPQKPYSIELIDALGNSIDSSILGMPAENDWLLLANYNDKSFARNVIPFELFDSLGHYGVRSKHVDVVLDGEYQGIYLLSEKIKRDSNRVDIAKLDSTEISGNNLTGGYIFKVDYWDNTNSWQSNYSPIGFPGLDVHFVYYYPKPEVIQLEQQTYIQNFVDEFESVLYSPSFDDPINGYRKYISTTSFIDYFIVNEVARNGDGYKKSRFFSKDKDNLDGTIKKLKAGPVWDFDWALKDMWGGSEDGSQFMYNAIGGQDVNAPGWYIRLLQDTVFANEVRCRYEDFRRNILSLPYLHAKVDSIAAVVMESQEWHYLTWGHLSSATGTPEVQAPPATFAEEVQRLKDWFTRRIEWLDVNMPGTLNGCSFTNIDELGGVNYTVYPNPFASFIAIDLGASPSENGEITLVDAAGRIIQQQNISPNGTQHFELLNLGDLMTGVYFVEVKIGNRKTVQKLVK